MAGGSKGVFRGLYDKLVSFIFDTSRVSDYNPTDTDYVAVYESLGAPRNINDDATWMPKKYVKVTDIGTGGDGSFSSFDAQGSGVVQVSLDGTTYVEGPLTVTNGNTLYVQATSIPSGLTWQGTYNSGSAYAINDVVSTVNGSGVYSTWWAQSSVPAGQAPPASGTSNAYWVQLGTQGPQGVEGPANSVATTNFRTVTANTNVQANGTYGTDANDRGAFILTNSIGSITVTIPLNLSEDPATGIPLKSQVSVMNINTGPVQIVGAGGVTVRSADNANYLRTQYSSATLIRKAANEWYLFGDLTNIA